MDTSDVMNEAHLFTPKTGAQKIKTLEEQLERDSTTIGKLQEKLITSRKRVRAAYNRIYRQKKKMVSIENVLNDLKTKSYISDQAFQTLQVFFFNFHYAKGFNFL